MNDKTEAPVTPTPPEARHVKPRTTTIPLDWPVEYARVIYSSVTLRRLTTRQVADFIKACAALSEDANVQFPIYVDGDGNPIPDAVIDAIDDDDAAKLSQAAADFLPQRWKRQTDGDASLPATGGSTERSSVAK